MKSRDQKLLEEAYKKILLNEELEWEKCPHNPGRAVVSKEVFDMNGMSVKVKAEEDRDDDSVWYDYSLVDPETHESVQSMNWNGKLSHEDVINYIKMGSPRGVKTPQGVRVNMNSKILGKFVDGSASEEGYEIL